MPKKPKAAHAVEQILFSVMEIFENAKGNEGFLNAIEFCYMHDVLEMARPHLTKKATRIYVKYMLVLVDMNLVRSDMSGEYGSIYEKFIEYLIQ